MRTRSKMIVILTAMALMISTIVNLPAHANVPDTPKTEQHKFTLGPGERVKFGFVAKKAGAISAVVNVNSQSPVSVSLTGPQGKQPITKQGKGEIKLDVPAGSFADDSMWFVSIDEPQHSKTNFGKPIASGTVSISYMPADKAVADRLTATNRADLKQKIGALKSKSSRQGSSQTLIARRAALEKERNQRHAQQKERALHKVHIVVAGGGQPSTGQPSPQPTRQSTQQTTFKGQVNPHTAAKANNTRAPLPKGSNGTPQIASLDVTEGDPGTPIVISGTNFGSAQGEVHFIINPGQDVTAPVENGTWSDTQIMAYVPDASGIQAFNGQMYVKMAGGGKSALTPFHFIPAMDVQYLPVTDKMIKNHADGCGSGTEQEYLGLDGYTEVVWHSADCTEGYADDDSFLSNTTLTNNWVYDSASVQSNLPDGESSKDAWASLKTPDSSYKGLSKATIQVHWFATASENFVYYDLNVTVKGPKGTSPTK